MKNNNEELTKRFTPKHKMGFKILEDIQLKNMFPTYENLFEKIDIHREQISQLYDLDMNAVDYQYNLMYDNIFSILGSRGSGKTSAIFTLKNMISKRYENDIVLPIIMPELIPDNCDIISWILAIIGQTVTDLEGELEQNSGLVRDPDYFSNCRFKSVNKLRTEYNHVKELYFSKGYNLGLEGSFNAAIGNSELQIQNSFEFSKALSLFWTTLKEAILKARNVKNQKEPLIYLIFDDVDLTPNKVVEMLSTIIKYLSHPNLIIIVTADEDLFYEVVENSLNKKIGNNVMDLSLAEEMILLNRKIEYHYNENFNDSVLMSKKKRISKTAKLYLGKILPPSCRYYLNTFDTCARRMSFIDKVEEVNGRIYICDLESLLRDNICSYIKQRTGKVPEEYHHFLYYKNDRNKFLKIFLVFWGNTSRQLANECFIVEELFSRMKKAYTNSALNEDVTWLKREIYQQVYHFLYNSINSSGVTDLESDEITELVNQIWFLDYDQWPLYISYDFLNEYYEQKMEEIDDPDTSEGRRLIRFIISMFSLLYFVENILLISDKVNDKCSINIKRKKVHGESNLVTFLDLITKNENSLIKRSNEEGSQSVIYMYDWLLENPEKIMHFDRNKYSDVKEYLYIMKEKNDEANLITEQNLYKWITENPKWCMTMTKMTYLAFENLFLIGLKDFNFLDFKRQFVACDTYIKANNEMIREHIRDFFKHRYLLNLMPGIDKIYESINEFCNYRNRGEIICRFNNVQLTSEDNPNKRLSLLELKRQMDVQFGKIADEMNQNRKPAATLPPITEHEGYLIYLIEHPKFKDILSTEWSNKKEFHVKVSYIIDRLKMEMFEHYEIFRSYYIKDYDEYEDIMDEMKNQEIDYKLDMMIKDAIDRTNDQVIDRSTMDNLLNEMRAVGRKFRNDMWNSIHDRVSGLYVRLIDTIELNIEGNMKTAQDFIALCECYQYFQNYYLESIIKYGVENTSPVSFTDVEYSANKEKTFYGRFYEIIKKIVNQVYAYDSGIGNKDKKHTITKRKRYMAAIFRGQMELAGQEYYNSMIAGEGQEDE